MVFRPRGILDQKAVLRVVRFLDKEEDLADQPFHRFTDTSKLGALDLNERFVYRIALHRRRFYMGRPPVKSAFYVRSSTALHYVKIHAVVTAYSGVLGPYPFGATGGVVTHLPVSFALENQTRPTYPGLPGATPALVAHEIAHQWFGDAVSVSGWRDIWLNEGFAQFLQTYYLTEVVSGRSMQNWLTDTYAGAADDQGFWELAIDDPGPEHVFSGAVYARGSMAVQALRHRIGETAFWTLLRTWVEERRYGNGSVADFEALASSISGQDLTAFFDAWLHARVVPTKTAANGLL